MIDFIGNTQAWGLILGILAPLLISVVQRPTFTRAQRGVVSVVAAACIGVITTLANGAFNVSDLLTTFALVLVSSHTAYEALWKPTGAAPAIESATSPGGGY